jgi:predicted enzyme related to lactoylglutathione lyase
MPPTPGEISYVQIPAVDVGRSADFYETVFGWNIRRRDGGRIALDDAAGEVSGAWLTERPPSLEPGLLIYINVEDVQRALERIMEAGGEIVTPRLLCRGKARRSQPSVIRRETSWASFTKAGLPGTSDLEFQSSL